ncbi:MAG: hypothetical protein IKL73_02815 [Lachnospiraceae bacterium]|nr:hypothetical protein [Lachnospira sp.]MBR6697186.1 hypothetical protein [Lachnospiraceae bacterium]
MKIDTSAIAMSSERHYSYYAEKSEASMVTTADKAATLNFSKEGVSLMEQMKEEQLRLQREQREQRDENMAKAFSEQLRRTANEPVEVPEYEEDLKIQLLRKMLKALNSMRDGKFEEAAMELERAEAGYKKAGRISVNANNAVKLNAPARTTNGTLWTRTTVKSAFVSEVENTAYQATGIVKTADGREISFGVSVEMSRAFCAQYESLTQEEYIVTDPLVINLDNNVASVTDQKFLFDLDSDGTKDEISFVGEGSGFLALDKNADGVINDGRELFGTESGNGFKDLAQYDLDGNGWIDENDKVFEDLRVWTKDAEGNDRLIDLKKAGVGAIYLESASTEYSLKNEQHLTDAIIRQTGIYLKENGQVSTIQHVDLAM